MDAYVQPSSANGGYDFTCYGPNGFQRRFAGNIQKDRGQIETSSLIDPAGGTITLTLLNSSTNAVNYTVKDNLNGPATNSYNLSPAGVANCAFLAVSNNSGWYDLTVTADADTNFLRHLAGHIENGAFSTTEIPAIVGNTLVVATNLPTGGTGTNGTAGAGSTGHGTNNPPGTSISSISDLVNYLIAQNSLATAGTNNLTLTIGSFGTNCALIYPGWASHFVVQSSGNYGPLSWAPLGAAAATVSNCNVVIFPLTNTAQFFRLSQ
jgi:hypothetical protein